VIATGVLGLLATVLIAYPASLITFKNDRHVWAIAALSVVVLFAEVQAGQTALLQGMRRIRDITALTITGAIWSTALAIPILLIFRERGIVPFLIAVAAGQMIASWWYARRVKVETVKVDWADTWRLSRSMLRLGLSFVATGMAASISLYAIRLTISHALGEAAVGLYQSAFTLSGIYVGFILQAMGGDYYPRLAGVGDDALKRNQLVNEQTKVAILLASPGLVAALVFSDILIQAMYSARFAGAAEILRWQVLGLLGRAVAWPMSFILLARSDSKAFMASELTSAVLHVAFVWAGVSMFGAQGAGMAFALLYFCYGAAMWLIVGARHGYKCSGSTLTIVVAGSIAVAAAFALTFVPSLWVRGAMGGLLLLVTGTVSMEVLADLAPASPPARLWRVLRKYTPVPVLVQIVLRRPIDVSVKGRER
jgi:PST family polysaccharide transporter